MVCGWGDQEGSKSPRGYASCFSRDWIVTDACRDVIRLADVEPIHWGAMVGSTFTLVNAAVSASLLTLPYAFKKAGTLFSPSSITLSLHFLTILWIISVGIIQGVFLVVILGILARFIDWRLVRYGHRFKSTSYAGMIATALGDRVGIFLSSLVAVSLFAGLVGLLVRNFLTYILIVYHASLSTSDTSNCSIVSVRFLSEIW